MPELIRPTVRLGESFAEAIDEFIAEGRGGPDDNSLTGDIIRNFANRREGSTWVADFLEFEGRWETDPPEYFVPMSVYWWVEGDRYLGRISIRHRLNQQLSDIGGHIGYDMRPSARRRGHATAMLAAALPRAAELGIDRALITCDRDNVASRKVIERNGGVYEDRRGKKLRFWVPTRPRGGGRPDRQEWLSGETRPVL
ncbi:GNAT family N-acetyltransferase [Glycomyces xiaoerkulensis]|uniref:GNAT family N-acetyltransferase n=1 Tax=Glycomyces xiaoerkulensis TaxID=2038139 RepID=UPI000C263734|nr:GNAT family N-acetyltransferase [Glycomyces xiaoerkulensis]